MIVGLALDPFLQLLVTYQGLVDDSAVLDSSVDSSVALQRDSWQDQSI